MYAEHIDNYTAAIQFQLASADMSKPIFTICTVSHLPVLTKIYTFRVP